MRTHRLAVRIAVIGALAALVALRPSAASTQTSGAAPPQAAAAAPPQAAATGPTELAGGPTPPVAIPVSEIPVRLAKTAELVRRAGAHAQSQDSIREIEEALPRFTEGARALLTTSRNLLKTQLPTEASQELKNAWAVIGRRLDSWQALLQQRSGALQADLEALEAETATWTLLHDSAAAQQLPAALRTEVAQALDGIRRAGQLVVSRRNAVLMLQAKVSELSVDLDEMREQVDRVLAAGGGRLFRLDSPPIWNIPRALPAPVETGSVGVQSTESVGEVLQYYVASILEFVAVEIAAFVTLLIALALMRKRAAAYLRDDDEAVRGLGFAIRRPFSTAVLLTTVGSAIGTAAAPNFLADLGFYVMLVPLVRVIPGLGPTGLRPFIWTLAGVYLAAGALAYVPASSTAARILMLLIAVAAAVALLLYDGRLRSHESGGRWRRLARLGVRAGLILTGAAAIGEIVGAASLGRYLGGAVLRSVLAAAALYAALTILRGFLQVVLRALAAHGDALWRMPDDLARALSGGLTWLAFVLYVTLLLRAFQLWEALLAVTTAVLRFQVSIGALTFTVGSAVAFAAVLLVASVGSRVLRFFLTAWLQGRIEMQRGKSHAVARLAHYTILAVGFLLALGAAGVNLNKFTVLAGALGVGLGFGLQNIVNNFVSGLILLFERPLQVGDKVTIGDTSGEVKDIGIRASTVVTWDGADVIIPNATLVSGNVTNWTLTSDRRRSELTVGTAYGSDPQVVLRILRDAALEHPLVLEDPEPAALLIGFGESSLDFCLRYWTSLEHVGLAASQLRVDVYRRLAAERIEIPFPQREVLLRNARQAGAEPLPWQT